MVVIRVHAFTIVFITRIYVYKCTYVYSNVTDSAHNPADKGDGEATNLTSLRSLDEDIPTEASTVYFISI